MKRNAILLGLLFALISTMSQLKASHMMGVDLTYECLNSCTIRVHLRAYRDCSGASGIANGITFTALSPGCGQPTAVTPWSAQVTTEVTPLCPGASTQCSDPGATINGVEEYYWFRDYDICNVPNCIFSISWGGCCRNGAITSGAGNQGMYTSNTTLNTNITPCNGSPQFVNPPVPYICAGQPYVFNQGAIDPEGDSLAYSLGTCYSALPTTSVLYSPGYSPTQPLGSTWNVSINAVTGDITCLPTPGNVVVGVMCVYVTEWRNGVMINTIVRDIQMTVLNCPLNTLPQVTNLTNPVNAQINGFSVTTCVNNPLCFNIPTVDPNLADIVTITWSQNIPGGVFSQVGNPSVINTIVGTPGNPPQAQFCWTPTAIGSYSFLVTVSDNACPIIGQSQFTIQINVTNLQTNILANSPGCGQVNLCAVANLGVPPYTFLWSGPGGLTGNPNVTDSCLTHTYPSTGTYDYFLQVTDANGCVGFDTGQVSVVINVVAGAGPDVFFCNGGNSILGTPALPNYSYSWSPANGLSNPSAAMPVVTRPNTGLTPSVFTYVITATDNTTGCSNQDTVLVTVWPQMTPSTVTTPTSCFAGSDGTATVNILGGVPPLVFQWSASAGNQTTQTATNLAAGTYNVTVTDSGGCSVTSSATVAQPTQVGVTATMTPVSCFGGNNGTITAQASGGAGGYTYLWQPINLPGANIPGRAAGAYTVLAQDANGCPATATITVTEPSQLQLSITSTPTTCALPIPNGTATVTPSGGTAPYNYLWSSAPAQTTIGAFGLPGGNYTVTVTDANGCTATASVTVGNIPPPTVVAGPDASFCEGAGGVNITATPGSGTPGYWLAWWCQSGNCGLSNVNGLAPNANPTVSQYYYVQVTDTNGCVSNIDSLWVTVLPKPIVNAGPDQYICGDSAPCVVLSPSISNAAGPYTYNWFGSLGLNDPTIMNPCARPDTTTPYTLVVTAGNGCSSDFTTTDTLSTVIVHVNPIPVADAGPDREICEGDSIELEGLGFNAGPVYSFEWSPSAGMSSTTQPNPNVAPAITTTYTLVVWSNGCPSYGDQVLVDVHTNPTVDAGPAVEMCLTESILLDAQAGGDSTATYTFNWWPTQDILDPSVEDPTVSPVSTTMYYVQAMTNYGCESPVDSVLVTLKPTPVAEAGANFVLCEGSEAQLNGSYSFTTTIPANPSEVYYNWTPATNISSTTILDPVVNPTQSLWYVLEVYHNTCHTFDSVLVSVIPDLALEVSADTTMSCEGDSVQLTATSPLSNVSYVWSPTDGLGSPNSASTSAAPETSTVYWVYASQSGCGDTASIAINIIPTPNSAFATSTVSGCAPHEISVQQTSQEGVFYIWNFGDGSPVINFPTTTHTYTQAGTYEIQLTTVGDGGCQSQASPVTVTVSPAPVLDFTSDPEFPAQLSLPNTLVNFFASIQNASSWTWDFGDGITSSAANPSHTYNGEGNFMVTLTGVSSEGCVASVVHGPYVILSPELFIPNVFTPNGDDIGDRFLVEYTGSQPFNITVFDRWGLQLYQATNKWEGWTGVNKTGDVVPDGIYFWVVKVGDREFAGNVTLVR